MESPRFISNKPKKNYRATLTKIVYSLAISLMLVLLISLFSPVFKVKTIQTNAYPKDLEKFPKFGDKFLFEVSEDIIKNYFYSIPKVKSIDIEKRYPNTLVIDVKYRDSSAIVKAKNGYYLVDNEGVVFDSIAKFIRSGLPIINLYQQDVDIGTNITQNGVKNTLDIVNLTKQIDLFKINEIMVLPEGVIYINLNDGVQVIINENSKAEEIVSSLQTIIRRFTIEGKTISTVDFRFEKPFVTLK